MKISECNILIEKAKSRKDGVYSYKGYLYVVKKHAFVAFSDPFGVCYQRMGSFNVRIGKVDRHDRRKNLADWLKQQK